MLSRKLTKELTDQITYELESAYIYLGMAGWAEGENLDRWSCDTQRRNQPAARYASPLL